jgi:hypothetical protein
MIVWDSRTRNWFELDGEAVDALAEFGPDVAGSRITEDDALQTVIQACRATRMESDQVD